MSTTSFQSAHEAAIEQTSEFFLHPAIPFRIRMQPIRRQCRLHACLITGILHQSIKVDNGSKCQAGANPLIHGLTFGLHIRTRLAG